MHKACEKLRLQIRQVHEGRYLLGLSGGADSTMLLTLLAPDAREGRIRLEAVHVNHGLRGAESDEDERFCRELCEKEGVPFTAYKAELGGRKDEASARTARFAFFRERCLETGADALILAHNADDQAETFLMRLLRGAGPEGLECMRSDEITDGIRILRPMLGIRRDEIREALRTDSLSWREDSTNGQDVYLRNRIRKELVPAMERIAENAVEKICRTAGQIADDNDTLNERTEKLIREHCSGSTLEAAAIAAEPAGTRKRVLRKWWTMNGPRLKEHALSAAQTDELDRLLISHKGKINLPGNRHAVRTGRYLFLTGNEEKKPDPVSFCTPETAFGSFRLTVTPSEGRPGNGKTTQEVPEDFCDGCVIRTRKDGDRIRPFGCAGHKKLQDFLTDRKIEEPFRDRIPLLCRGDEVLLVCGVGAGDIPGWNPDDHPVRLTWHGDMPWAEKTGE